MPTSTPQASPIARLDAEAVSGLLDEIFPQIHEGGRVLTIAGVAHRWARVHMAAHPKNLRPGNTLSGPSMFWLADLSFYAAILATLGPEAAQAVTTNLNITFLSRPPFIDIMAEARLIKVGRRLVVADVAIMPATGGEMLAHAVGTYARAP